MEFELAAVVGFYVYNNFCVCSAFAVCSQDRSSHVVEAQLFTRQARPESFRKYTVVAENNVAIATRDVELIRSKPQSLGRAS